MFTIKRPYNSNYSVQLICKWRGEEVEDWGDKICGQHNTM